MNRAKPRSPAELAERQRVAALNDGDEKLRRLWEEQNSGHHPPLRTIRVEGGVCAHPDDLKAQLTRLPEFRDSNRKRSKR